VYQSSYASCKVKGFTGSNHCFWSRYECSNRGDRLACKRVPKLVPMVFTDINALLRRPLTPRGGRLPPCGGSRHQPCYFLSGAIGTGEVAAVFGRAKQLPPLALLLSSQTGCV
jgi:hypothetical protein